MTTLALTAPTAWFGDPEIVSGFDLTAIAGTSIAANTTVYCPVGERPYAVPYPALRLTQLP